MDRKSMLVPVCELCEIPNGKILEKRSWPTKYLQCTTNEKEEEKTISVAITRKVKPEIFDNVHKIYRFQYFPFNCLNSMLIAKDTKRRKLLSSFFLRSNQLISLILIEAFVIVEYIFSISNNQL